jgi:hypothetical protein
MASLMAQPVPPVQGWSQPNSQTIIQQRFTNHQLQDRPDWQNRPIATFHPQLSRLFQSDLLSYPVEWLQ